MLVPACNKMMGDHPYHIAGKKYADAVRLAGCLPLVIPNADEVELQALLAIADGVFLTGSPSNVHPSHFDEDVLDLSLPLDPARDAWTLPLIRHALAVGLPLFTVCRGTQETNVALGGSLHQAVHDVAGKADHRADHDKPVDVQYGPAHEVFVEPGGVLERVVGLAKFDVNSVHGQAVNRLGRRPARGSARARRRGRGVLRRRRQGLQPLRAMAPRMAGRRQRCLDAHAHRLRRGLPTVEGRIARPASVTRRLVTRAASATWPDSCMQRSGPST